MRTLLGIAAIALLSPLACSDDIDEVCGNGIVESEETCDEGATPGPGCVACEVQGGWLCRGGTNCGPVCGDGLRVGNETCDEVSDGCDNCQVVTGWTCTSSACRPLCGDGRILGDEACDDMNTGSGDGCDATCRIEDDFICEGEPSICGPSCVPKSDCDALECGDVDDGCGSTIACGPCTGWFPARTLGAPERRRSHWTFWTGETALVVSGFLGSGWTHSGGTYDPVADRWALFDIEEVDDAHSSYAVVFTGSSLIAWGGTLGTIRTNIGWRYDLAEDHWSATSTIGAPSSRRGHVATWTGTEMFVFGGGGDQGGLYDPVADQWRAVPSSTTAATSADHALWTGTEVVLVGRGPPAMFSPSTGRWRIGAEGPRTTLRYSSAVWTGTEVFMYVTSDDDAFALLYDPAADTWREAATEQMPGPRNSHVLVWSGEEAIVWGGRVGFAPGSPQLGDGARYDPATDRWRPVTPTDALEARHWHSATWTDHGMFVWGGQATLLSNDGALYVPD